MHDFRDEVSGFTALEAALYETFGEVVPVRVSSLQRRRLGGDDPLDDLRAYPLDGSWVFVTFGFSELYDKQTADAEVSGFGFELTLRVPRRGETQPPGWAIRVLQDVARRVFSDSPIRPGDALDLGPLDPDGDTLLTGVLVAADPQLKAVRTPNGLVRFFQLVGISHGEFRATRMWSGRGLLRLVRERDFLLSTDLDRPSYLSDPDFELRVQKGWAQDGSETPELLVPSLQVERAGMFKNRLRVRLDRDAVRDIALILPGRIPYGRDLHVSGLHAHLIFHSASTSSFELSGTTLTLHTTPELCSELARELPDRGHFASRVLPKLVFDVASTD